MQKFELEFYQSCAFSTFWSGLIGLLTFNALVAFDIAFLCPFLQGLGSILFLEIS